MAKAPNPVRLQVLLRSGCRNEKGRSEAAAALQKSGLEVTGSGLASISVRGAPAVVSRVFGAQSSRIGVETEDLAGSDLTVPDTLTEYVERISIAPQHVAMSDETSSGDREQDKESS